MRVWLVFPSQDGAWSGDIALRSHGFRLRYFRSIQKVQAQLNTCKNPPDLIIVAESLATARISGVLRWDPVEALIGTARGKRYTQPVILSLPKGSFFRTAAGRGVGIAPGSNGFCEPATANNVKEMLQALGLLTR